MHKVVWSHLSQTQQCISSRHDAYQSSWTVNQRHADDELVSNCRRGWMYVMYILNPDSHYFRLMLAVWTLQKSQSWSKKKNHADQHGHIYARATLFNTTLLIKRCPFMKKTHFALRCGVSQNSLQQGAGDLFGWKSSTFCFLIQLLVCQVGWVCRLKYFSSNAKFTSAVWRCNGCWFGAKTKAGGLSHIKP